MNYRVLNWRLEGITGGELRSASIDAVCREVNYPRGWESLERMHAAVRKWAEVARPGDVFLVTQNVAIVAAVLPPIVEDLCPDCGFFEGLDHGPLRVIVGGDVEQDLACPNCGGRWTDRFSRVGRRPSASYTSAELPQPPQPTEEPDGD